MKNYNRMVIAGGSGFLGQSLVRFIGNRFKEVVILSRNQQPAFRNVRFAAWDAKSSGAWEKEIDGCDLLINLTGKSVNCRYTEKNKKEILESRVNSTQILNAAVLKCKTPPIVWINASSATIYKNSETQPQNELTGEIGDDFNMNVCKEWERVFFSNSSESTRKVALRIALVLGKGGGVLKQLIQLTRLGLGGHHGSGNQMMSWVHEEDIARCILFCLENEKVSGPINCVAPNALTNRAFMRTLRNELHVPFGLPQPEWMLAIGALFMQTETELILKSRWAVPAKCEQFGFKFAYENASDALKNLCSQDQ